MSSIRANNISLERKGESDAKGRGKWGDAENITLPFVHLVHGKGLKYAHTHSNTRVIVLNSLCVCMHSSLCRSCSKAAQNTLGYCTLDAKSKQYYIYSGTLALPLSCSPCVIVVDICGVVLPLMLLAPPLDIITMLSQYNNDWHICYIVHRISICVWNVSHLPNENQLK